MTQIRHNPPAYKTFVPRGSTILQSPHFLTQQPSNPSPQHSPHGPLLLTWFNFNPRLLKGAGRVFLPIALFINIMISNNTDRGESDYIDTLIARFMGATWGPSGAGRTQVGTMLAPWTLLSGCMHTFVRLAVDLCHSHTQWHATELIYHVLY